MILTLPFPPSTNTYYRKFRNRMVIGAKGRAYKKAVAQVCKQLPLLEAAGPMPGWVSVTARLFPPDARRRDIDNFCGKALLDSLKGIAFGDDSFVWRLSGEWAMFGGKPMPTKGGAVVVEIRPL